MDDTLDGETLSPPSGVLEATTRESVSVHTELPPLQSKTPRFTTSFTSGGATGADLYWTEAVLNAGLRIDLMSFPGHSIAAPSGAWVFRLTDVMLQDADAALASAARALKRSIPNPGYVKRLLQRNWFIVKDADALFAVGKVFPTGDGLRVDGGTAWGCQMYYNRVLQEKTPPMMWLFDLVTLKWLKCTPSGEWQVTERPSVSKFTKVALIGSRDLGIAGIAAIDSIEFG